nr:pentapeptide repeat-containing protein [Actinomadura rayongensis]
MTDMRLVGWLVRRRASGPEMRRPARMMPMWASLGGTFVTAVAVAGGALWVGLDLLDVHGVRRERQISSSVLFDLVKLSFAVVAGLGGLVALVVAYRKQRTEENAALRENTKLHSDRFTSAVAQLGDSSPAIQLGGVHALAGLADDAPTRQLRQTCIDVLCAYLRLPYDPEPSHHPGDGQDPAELARARTVYRALREVRHTIIRIIGNHLRDDATVVSWQGHDFDFTDVVFDGGDLSQAVFTGGTVSFRKARFVDGTIDLNYARFASDVVNFGGARFEGGRINFLGAAFTGGAVIFSHARFEGGTVTFGSAYFEGGMATFRLAEFRGGKVDFGRARFEGGKVDFGRARFEGGKVDFGSAKFKGGTVDFGSALFMGGKVDFGSAEFRGGTVHFERARFEGGAVNFARAMGQRPMGLPDGIGEQLDRSG